MPPVPNVTDMFWHTAVGARLSATVTEAEQVAVLFDASVAVKVTVLEPKFVQVKLFGTTDTLTVPQLSVLPLFTALAARVAVPLAPSVTDAFLHKAVGGVLSVMITAAEHVDVLPEASLTVSTTVLPGVAQVNVLGVTDTRFTVLQLSVLPLFTCEGVIEAVPPLPKETVTGWHTAEGGVLSKTCTVAAQDELLLLPSVTVIITVLKPTLKQV